ncbi:MAG: glycosyl hydrolase [Thermoleophilia bacterium]
MHAIEDRRDGTLYCCAATYAYGATVHRSPDGGRRWERALEVGLPPESGLALERTWHLRPGPESRPGELWLGSQDGGRTFQALPAILFHPTRERWQPGAGGMCCHSIEIHPAHPDTLVIAISAAGAFRSEDGGDTWTPINRGVLADFFPDSYPEVGHCVHKLLMHRQRPERLWQQNHCGVYRSDDGGATWIRLDENGLPSRFGFPIVIHPRDPDTAYVIPEEADVNRVTAGGRLGVYRTRDAGASWQLVAEGLPAPAWTGVLREAAASDELEPAGIYFGTQSGSVYVSPDEGDTWIEAARQLPPILSVEVTWA